MELSINELASSKNRTYSVALLVSVNVFAWSGEGAVTELISHDGIHVIYTDLPDAPCSNPNLGVFYWPTSDEDSRDMFSLALAAMMSGKKIRVAHSGASGCTGFGAALVTHVRVLN